VLALIALRFISQGAATRLRGQSLSARPVMFADPAPGGPAPGRELVLGTTTLTAAKRIFAVELQDETVQLPRGHAGNPERLRRGAEWRLAEATLHPEYRLDLAERGARRAGARIRSCGACGLPRVAELRPGGRRSRAIATSIDIPQPCFDDRGDPC